MQCWQCIILLCMARGYKKSVKDDCMKLLCVYCCQVGRLISRFYHVLVVQSEIAALWPYACSSVCSNGCHNGSIVSCQTSVYFFSARLWLNFTFKSRFMAYRNDVSFHGSAL